MTRDFWLKRLATGGIVACVVTVAATVAYPFVSAALGWSSGGHPGYAVGDRVDLPPSMYAKAAHTLVIFGRSGCGVCQRMKPLLTDMVARVGRAPSMAAVLVTSASDLDAEVQFARDIGLTADDVNPLDLGTLRLKLVPTVVIVNRHGEVQFVHTGEAGSSGADAELLRIVSSFALDR